MGLLDDFLTGYQGATGKANQALGEYFEDYKTWAGKNKEMLPGAINKFGDYINEVANLPGADVVVPMGGPLGYVAKNYRTAEQIQQLRKLMAQENVARGAIGVAHPEIRVGSQITDPKQYLPGAEWWPTKASSLETIPDPIDRLYRGSWYHGLSTNARRRIVEPYKQALSPVQVPRAPYTDNPIDWANDLLKQFDKRALDVANQTGFPLSLHDINSISNKLGEPAGISLSMLPIKSKEFAADEFIHRVMPLYGGRPSERIVNLMTKEGRNTLNDAYDVVFNRFMQQPVAGRPEYRDLTDALAQRFGDRLTISHNPLNVEEVFSHSLPTGLSQTNQTGPFNLALSQQLQSMGKRGLLYNPQRWNEYEMLMLDPKFVLPLDYRKFQEYARPNVTRAMRSGSPVGVLDERSATPGIQTGLSQIQDLMSQNASRLGDIYAERPWTQRLNVENKNRLLELVDPEYREVVGNQLYSSTPYELDIPF